MIWKLLRRNLSVWQIAGYAVASLVGLVILMVAGQFYLDVAPAMDDDNNDGTALIGLSSSRNIVISKPVGLSATMTGETPSFSDSEIARLRRQPWADDVQAFQAADFGVYASLDMGGRSMSTALFFESVPDNVLDISPEEWHFHPSSPEIPIILPKDYLTLYNFGFAASGRAPMLTEGMIGTVPLTITLTGNGRRVSMTGRIVGFSSTLNTVAVPTDFMDWAHRQFGDGSRHEPSRLIITLSKEGDPGVAEFMDRYGYDVAGGDKDLGRTSYFVTLLVSVVAAIGLIITLLALGILVLSVYLLVQKNRKAISGLLLLGYTPGSVARRYIALVGGVNVLVAIVGAIALSLACPLWRGALAALGVTTASPVAVILGGMGLMAVITAINSLVIYRLVRKCF